jgi:hypothetical protein
MTENEIVPDEQTNPNSTFYDALVKRQKAQERVLAKEDLPEPRLMSHAHVTARSGMIQLTFWVMDPITRNRSFVRVAVPYDHFLLCARGIVDAHDERISISLHEQSMEE